MKVYYLKRDFEFVENLTNEKVILKQWQIIEVTIQVIGNCVKIVTQVYGKILSCKVMEEVFLSDFVQVEECFSESPEIPKDDKILECSKYIELNDKSGMAHYRNFEDPYFRQNVVHVKHIDPEGIFQIIYTQVAVFYNVTKRDIQGDFFCMSGYELPKSGKRFNPLVI